MYPVSYQGLILTRLPNLFWKGRVPVHPDNTVQHARSIKPLDQDVFGSTSYAPKFTGTTKVDEGSLLWSDATFYFSHLNSLWLPAGELDQQVINIWNSQPNLFGYDRSFFDENAVQFLLQEVFAKTETPSEIVHDVFHAYLTNNEIALTNLISEDLSEKQILSCIAALREQLHVLLEQSRSGSTNVYGGNTVFDEHIREIAIKDDHWLGLDRGKVGAAAIQVLSDMARESTDPRDTVLSLQAVFAYYLTQSDGKLEEITTHYRFSREDIDERITQIRNRLSEQLRLRIIDGYKLITEPAASETPSKGVTYSDLIKALNLFPEPEDRASLLNKILEAIGGWPTREAERSQKIAEYSAILSHPLASQTDRTSAFAAEQRLMMAKRQEEQARHYLGQKYALYGGHPISEDEIAQQNQLPKSTVQKYINSLLEKIAQKVTRRQLKECVREVEKETLRVNRGYPPLNDASWLRLVNILNVALKDIQQGRYSGNLVAENIEDLKQISELPREAIYYAYFNARRKGIIGDREEAWFQMNFQPMTGSPGDTVAKYLGRKDTVPHDEMQEILGLVVDILLGSLPPDIQNVPIEDVNQWSVPYAQLPQKPLELDKEDIKEVLEGILIDLQISEMDPALLEKIQKMLGKSFRPKRPSDKLTFQPKIGNKQGKNSHFAPNNLLKNIEGTPRGRQLLDTVKTLVEDETGIAIPTFQPTLSGRVSEKEEAANIEKIQYVFSVLGYVLNQEYPGYGFDEVDTLLRVCNFTINDILEFLRSKLIQVGLLPEPVDEVTMLLESAEKIHDIPVKLEFRNEWDRRQALKQICADPDLQEPFLDALKQIFFLCQLQTVSLDDRKAYLDLTDLTVTPAQSEILELFDQLSSADEARPIEFNPYSNKNQGLEQKLFDTLGWTFNPQFYGPRLTQNNQLPLNRQFRIRNWMYEALESLMLSVRENRKLREELRARFVDLLKTENASIANLKPSTLKKIKLTDQFDKLFNLFVDTHFENISPGQHYKDSSTADEIVFEGLGWVVNADADFYVPHPRAQEIYPQAFDLLRLLHGAKNNKNKRFVEMAFERIQEQTTLTWQAFENLLQDRSELSERPETLQTLRITLLALLEILALDKPEKAVHYRMITHQLRDGDYAIAIDNLREALELPIERLG